MEKPDSRRVESVKVQCTKLVPTTVKAALTKKAYVLCVAKKFWKPKTTSRHQCKQSPRTERDVIWVSELQSCFSRGGRQAQL